MTRSQSAIFIPREVLETPVDGSMARQHGFLCREAEGIFNGLVAPDAPGVQPGRIFWLENPEDIREHLGDASDRVRLAVRHKQTGDVSRDVKGYVRVSDTWQRASVQPTSLAKDMTERFEPLIQTGLSGSSVLIVGVGSGGASIALELAKCGVEELILLDHDRLGPGNVIRHEVGLSDVGRLKTSAMADRIRDKNPLVRTIPCGFAVGRDTRERTRELIQNAKVVISAVDDHATRLILNRICFEEKKPLILAGVFQRAHGGQVLRVHPGESPCYQCFVQSLPATSVRNQEVSSAAQAERLAYSDRPVPIEPGLSMDIAPVALMAAKLALQELLRGRSPAFSSLDEDLVAAWYLWINRRDPKSQYATLDPLEFNIDGLHVLRWYGVALARRPDCPCCGQFELHTGSDDLPSIPEPVDLTIHTECS